MLPFRSSPTISFFFRGFALTTLPPFTLPLPSQGRPKDGPEDKFRLTPVGARLSESLSCPVSKLDDCVGDVVKEAVAGMDNGSVCLLENVRFYKDEEKNGKDFAKQLSEYADLYVNDAFGTAHRAHASTAGVTKYLSPSVAGFLLQKELDYLDGAVSNPERPFCAIVGGSKVSSKIGVIETLINKVDKVVIGGGMIFTFYKARGKRRRLVARRGRQDRARQGARGAPPRRRASSSSCPRTSSSPTSSPRTPPRRPSPWTNIPEGWMGLDNGPTRLKSSRLKLADCKTVIWNGPMGVFELEAFNKGTFGVCDTLAKLDAITIIGGGDSVAAVEMAGLADKMSHISTGGGASSSSSRARCSPASTPPTRRCSSRRKLL